MPIRADEVPVVNGRLKQIGKSFRSNRDGARVAVFQCECGKKELVRWYNVRYGRANSCGCLRKLNSGTRTHGYSQSNNKTYVAWASMHQRCKSKRGKWFKSYTCRGIVVCDRWLSFESFLEDMGEAPNGASLDRINNDGSYEPSNCRWADRKTQSRNRTDNVWLIHNGARLTLTDWSNAIGIHATTIQSRLKCGWSVERALTEPVNKKH
jgi:hypothetical protein